MRRFLLLIISAVLAFAPAIKLQAADGKVTYNGQAKQFIFEPGSEYSPTDLFPNFKDVMPGDSLTQKITVKNDVSHNVKVKIYMRSLGAHEESKEFLSQLGLRVRKSTDNEMAYMFDATADETAQLTDWVYLGTLYSGGEVNLDVILDVSVELDNEFQSKIGYLDWEFMIEEYPVEDSDPKPPQTGDETDMGIYLAVCGIAIFIIIILMWNRSRKRRES